MNTREFLDELDAVIALCMRKETDVPCKKGCCHCCSEALYVDEREADLMVESIPPALRPTIQMQTIEWLRRAEPLLPMPYPIDGFEWRKLNNPCPFLVHGECSVYDVRPMGCRMFFAKGKAENCVMPMREQQQFAEFPAQTIATVAFPWFKSATEGVCLDHLGVFLAWKLCHIPAAVGHPSAKPGPRAPGMGEVEDAQGAATA